MNLRPELVARILRLRRQNGYSVQGISQRLGVTRRTVSAVIREDLTPLNVRTTRKYRKCQELGGCVPSEVMVVRPFPLGHMALPECVRCRVPIRGRGKAMHWNYFDDGAA